MGKYYIRKITIVRPLDSDVIIGTAEVYDHDSTQDPPPTCEIDLPSLSVNKSIREIAEKVIASLDE